MISSCIPSTTKLMRYYWFKEGIYFIAGGLVDKLTHMLPAETSPGGHISFDNLTDVHQNDSQEKSFLEAFCSSIRGFFFYYYNNASLNS